MREDTFFKITVHVAMNVPFTIWLIDGFVSRMSQLQRFVTGEDKGLVSSVGDAWYTMALVEAAFISSTSSATPLARKP